MWTALRLSPYYSTTELPRPSMWVLLIRTVTRAAPDTDQYQEPSIRSLHILNCHATRYIAMSAGMSGRVGVAIYIIYIIAEGAQYQSSPLEK